jgi:hypothetical protein
MTLGGFRTGMFICAGLLIVGGIISAIGIQNNKLKDDLTAAL